VASIKRTETVQVRHHLMAIYDNIDDQIKEAFEFLKEGLKRNKLLILTEDNSIDSS
jgi:hypothetical protein